MNTITGRIIAAALKIPELLRDRLSLSVQQERTLITLLSKAEATRFGENYKFSRLLSARDIVKHFQQTVPIHTYEQMFDSWWSLALNDQPDVTWPGTVPYFGRSSGTAGASSKYIPVTMDMVRSTNKVGMRQMSYLPAFSVPAVTYQKQVLLLGSTTNLKKVNNHLEGDLSGITALNMPSWLSAFYYRPGKKIVHVPEWNDRLDLIVREAWKWDIGTICGVPSWVQILLQRIVAHYKLRNIHEMWPNFNLYVHGGIAITNYRHPLEKLFGKKVVFMETYMASEGSFGFQARPGSGIRLVADAGIFYEFIPFNRSNFSSDGHLRPGAKACTLSEVQEDVNYAIVLSTCAGAWRYLIGDVVKFTNAALGELRIVGRTRQFLDHCGEHVSVDNITRTISDVSRELGIQIKEFGVGAETSGDLYAHHWFIGCDDPHVDVKALGDRIDSTLCTLNDDYAVERKSAIREVLIHVYPTKVFTDYLKWRGREGDMTKFPRVLKHATLKSWNIYLHEKVVKPLSSAISGN